MKSAFALIIAVLLPACAATNLNNPIDSTASQDTSLEGPAIVIEKSTANESTAYESIAHDSAQSSMEPKPDTLLAPESVGDEVLTGLGSDVDVLVSDQDTIPQASEEDEVQDIWDRIRSGFTLDYSNPGVQSDLKWFAANQAYLDRVVERARPFLYYIVTETEKRNMPLEIALLPVVESAFQTFAYSHGRAAGIWQFIPSTGRIYGLRQNWWYDGRRDVWASTQAALKYLEALNNKFDDWELALAAYNSGSGTVKRAIRKNKKRGRGIDFWSLRRNLPKETRGYVPKLLAIAAIVAEPERYGVELQSVDNEPYLARVELDGQLDLALAAEMADLSVEEIYALNPAFNRWATEPGFKSHLLLPLENQSRFEEQLALLPSEKRIGWKRHRVRRGETIGQIARRYNTTAQVIRKVNKLRGNMIRQGRGLIIPVALKPRSEYTHTSDKRKKRIQNTTRKGRVKKLYVVKEGDSFWTISRQFKVGVRQLAKWNAMAPRDRLSVGQKLVVWVKKRTSRITSIDTSRMIKPPKSRTKRWIRYTVRRGDSFSRIANKFRVTVAQLKRWNKRLGQGKFLQPGQRLKLFVDVTRQS